MNELDSKTLLKMLIPAKISAIVLFIFAIYVFGYEFFRNIHCINEHFDEALFLINKRFGIFDSKFYYHSFIFVLMLIGFLPSDVDPRKETSTKKIIFLLTIGLIAFFIPIHNSLLYIILTIIGFFSLMAGMLDIRMGMNIEKNPDEFNNIQESFSQCEEKIENKYSVNLPTTYYIKNDKDQLEQRHGYVNIINPFRASLVMGTPGSGKSFCFIEPAIKQMLGKYFSMYLYDFKFPTLTIPAYNHFLWAKEKAIEILEKAEKNGEVAPEEIIAYTNAQPYILNYDSPAFSNRSNPLNAKLVKSDTDAKDAAETIMLTLNPESRKNKDFFALSAINLVQVNIMFLQQHEGGKYCTFAHLVEFLNSKQDELFPILMSVRNLEGIVKPFADAFKEGAVDQLQGQVASALMPLVAIASENMWWCCTGEDFELDVNDPLEPKLLCIGNNPKKKDTYAPLISLYTNQIIKQLNEQGKHPSAVFLDELPTQFVNALNTLIATGRSNLIATFLGIQDNSQLEVNYGKELSTSIINTIGNFFSGQVQGDTAKFVSNLFGKNLQKTVSHTISAEGTISKSINEARDLIIPENKVSNLTQGFFVGRVADDFDQPIEKKLFHCKIDIDNKALKEEKKKYIDIPILHHFDKATAHSGYFKEFLNYFNSLFEGNNEVCFMIEEVMRLSDQECVYTFNPDQFNWNIDNLCYKTLEIIKRKLNFRGKLSQKEFDKKIKIKLLKYYIKQLIDYDFLQPMGKYNGNDNRYYVTIWMKAHVRANFYKVKDEVKDLVKNKIDDLLKTPEGRSLFRNEYLKKRFEEQEEFEEESTENGIHEATGELELINIDDEFLTPPPDYNY